jgi:hypothetical protein
MPPNIPPEALGLQYPALDGRKQKSPVDRGFGGCFAVRIGPLKTINWRSGRDSNPRPPA